MAQFSAHKVFLRDMQQALDFSHQVQFMIIQPSIGVHHAPHLLNQIEAIFFTPMLIDQLGCRKRHGPKKGDDLALA